MKKQPVQNAQTKRIGEISPAERQAAAAKYVEHTAACKRHDLPPEDFERFLTEFIEDHRATVVEPLGEYSRQPTRCYELQFGGLRGYDA